MIQFLRIAKISEILKQRDKRSKAQEFLKNKTIPFCKMQENKLIGIPVM